MARIVNLKILTFIVTKHITMRGVGVLRIPVSPNVLYWLMDWLLDIPVLALEIPTTSNKYLDTDNP